MKKTLLNMKVLSLAFLLAFAALRAYPVESGNLFIYQGGQNPADRIEALRVVYITEQLNLSPLEAEKFWPLYNAYKADLRVVQKHFGPDNGQLTADQQLNLEQQKLDLKKKYKPQFESALGSEKLNQLYNLERKFQEKLKEERERRIQQRNAMGPTKYGARPK